MKDFHVRRGAHWIVMSLFLTVAGCGGDSPTDGGNGGGDGGGGDGGPTVTTSVAVSNNFFNPISIQVSPDATVTWTWGAASNPHNVTFASTQITSSSTQTSGTYQTAMPTATGVYTYECTIHAGMNGSVTVQ